MVSGISITYSLVDEWALVPERDRGSARWRVNLLHILVSFSGKVIHRFDIDRLAITNCRFDVGGLILLQVTDWWEVFLILQKSVVSIFVFTCHLNLILVYQFNWLLSLWIINILHRITGSGNRYAHLRLLTGLDVNSDLALLPVFELENQALDDLNAVEHLVEVRLLQVEQLRDVLVVQDLFLHRFVRLQVVYEIPDTFSFVTFGLLD